eukprot:COSAG01_NODE_3105_length_6577_cov_4.068077_4_plen_137_part_00
MQASRATAHLENQALALNALGVNLQLQVSDLGRPIVKPVLVRDRGWKQTGSADQKRAQGELEQAIEHHRQHLDMAHEHTSQVCVHRPWVVVAHTEMSRVWRAATRAATRQTPLPVMAPPPPRPTDKNAPPPPPPPQ